MITPTPTSVSTSYSQYQAFGTTRTYYFAFIDPTILPASSLSSIKSEYAPYFTASCTVPYSYQTDVVTSSTGGSGDGSSDSGSGSGSSSSGDANDCHRASYSDGYYYYDEPFQTTYVCGDGSTYVRPLPLLPPPPSPLTPLPPPPPPSTPPLTPSRPKASPPSPWP